MSTQKYLCMHRGAPSQNKPSPAQMEVCADQRGVIQKTRGEGRIGHLKKEFFSCQSRRDQSGGITSGLPVIHAQSANCPE
jgi:hypothetical protein